MTCSRWWISREDTGVYWIVPMSIVRVQHGPRVKWYLGRTGCGAPSLTVTLEDAPRALNHQLPPGFTVEAARKVVAWATRNRGARPRFWDGGLSSTRDEVNAFIDGLAKLP